MESDITLGARTILELKDCLRLMRVRAIGSQDLGTVKDVERAERLVHQLLLALEFGYFDEVAMDVLQGSQPTGPKIADS